MFRLLGRKREAKETESKLRAAGDGGEGAEEQRDAGQLLEQLNGLVEQRSVSASVRSIIKAAIASAEQIVDSVKAQVAVEAQQEAAKIIAEAKKTAEKIESQKKPVQKESAEEPVSTPEQVAEKPAEEPVPAPEEVVAEVEEPAPALEEAVAEEQKPEPVEDQVKEPAAEEAVSSDEEPAVAEATAEATEPEKADKKPEAAAKEAPPVGLTEEQSKTLYTGEVELNVEVPIEPTMVAKLYNYLQTTPEIKFVRTTGSWNKGSTIAILLDKPLPLLAELVDKLPEANITPEGPEGKEYVRDRRRARRIIISLRS